ncbi:hypothetical protein GXW83_05460 [Streptacidiphilus sp. PB12-B1b]|uniref:hypothetical protein n=1 Tax=Streptacidiphilus sp. PB12-B1b TaxID=2705012 RepID=UPI0015F83AB5|nr:hypothetical protein [Streptacidiphilus sp. PB12-B1b]QMU75290.1 hypothetical protein GXW83_05460 [Streptacidiphilus sp. PB12-B1b]
MAKGSPPAAGLPQRPSPRWSPSSPVPARLARRWGPAAGEWAVGLAVALLFTWWARTVDDNPVVRSGQIAGLAALQFRLAVLGIPLLALVGWAVVRGGARLREWGVRLGAAGVAGLVSGFLAGGQVFMLRGTPWPINGLGGDTGSLDYWAQSVVRTGTFHNVYSPGIPHLVAWLAEQFYHGNAGLVFKPLLIVLTALTCPLVYLAWRMVLRPLPALGVAVLCGVSQYMPYKQYSPLILLLLVPVIAKLAQWLRGSPAFTAWGAVLRGAWLGVMLGVLFITYSGWHVWSFPGAVVLVLALFPWRRAGGRVRGLLLLGGTAVAFLAIGGDYTLKMLGASNTKDLWCSQITLTQPAYLGELPFSAVNWNQPGVFPNVVGTFAGLDFWTVAMIAGLGLAVALGLRRPAVLGLVACFGGSWLLRFGFAERMVSDQNIRLFPHTTFEIQYTLTALAVVGCVLVAERLGDLTRAVAALASERAAATPGLPALPRLPAVRFTAVGALLALLLAGGMAASAITDQYLPAPPSEHTGGSLAWAAHQLRKPDGACPRYAHNGTCTAPPTPPEPPMPTTGTIICHQLWDE